MGTDSTSWRTSWYIAVFPSNFGVSRITPRSIRGTSLWVATHVGVILAINYILRHPPVTVGTLWGPKLTSTARPGGVDSTSIANTDIIKTICGKQVIRLYISAFRVSLQWGNYILSNSRSRLCKSFLGLRKAKQGVCSANKYHIIDYNILARSRLTCALGIII